MTHNDTEGSWQARTSETPRGASGEHTVVCDAVAALHVSIYSLVEVRLSPTAATRTAVLFSIQYGRGISTSRLLDLHTGDEFTCSYDDAEAAARRIRPDQLPPEIRDLWPVRPSGVLASAGLNASKGFPEVDRDALHAIATTPKAGAQQTLFA